jgi:thiol-disulfide isomerase/thioredoxin/outer membrane lipoprotein-sorting protein
LHFSFSNKQALRPFNPQQARRVASTSANNPAYHYHPFGREKKMPHLLVLFSLLLLQAPNAAQSVPTPPAAAEVLRATLKALEKVEAVEYEVRRVAQNPSDQNAKLQTSILLAPNPFRFSAKTRDERGQVVSFAVSDGKTTRTSSQGKTGEHPTFVPGAMVSTTIAGGDVATTRQLFDANYLTEAIASQRVHVLSQSEVESELCHILVYARLSSRPELASTQYIWVSTVTGLPRAVQVLNIARGHVTLAPRLVLAKIRFNPPIPAETFTYQPKTTDTVTLATAKPAAAEPASIIGQQLPALEVRDVEFKPVKLSDFKGKPSLITFWASWCGPCLKEMPTLQKLQDEYKGKLQVLAIAVQEERRASLQFIKDHPQYQFTFLTEPTPGEENTPLQSFFKIQGIPVGAFVDAEGKILDRWVGFSNEEEFNKKIRGLMGQPR